ncbi:adaptor protein MecA [Streptococcus caprae]|uniref:Adapter protein MecA n=1 Tax=Streptococcus caprae TaxID=1640501 RepID=A0ABV8CX79_9STRE
MEMKQISDTTLKITISMDDLEERGMELRDFLIPQEKTEEFFYTVMDELDLPETFKNTGMLSFRVTPRQDRIDVFVTKSDLDQNLNFEELANMEELAHLSPDEFFKTLEETMAKHGDVAAHEQLAEVEKAEDLAEEEFEPAEFVHYILDFNRLSEVVEFAHSLDIPVEASELYKESEQYHLTILLNLIEKPVYYADAMHARLLEFAQSGTKTRAYLREHGVQLIDNQAIESLKTVRM